MNSLRYWSTPRDPKPEFADARVPRPESDSVLSEDGARRDQAASASVRRPIEKVSVIVPVRNEAEGIAELLNALARQTRLPDEIVVTDGGSVDGTPRLIREWLVAADIPLILVEDADAYPGRGRNLAISAARHDWIASIDAGVEPPPTWLESLMSAREEEPEAGVVFGRYAARTTTWFTTCAAIAYVGRSEQDRKSIASCLFHRSAWERAGGFPEELRSGEDLLFFKRLERAGVPTTFCRTAPVIWEAPSTPAATFRRFALYSRHSIRGGLWREWHVRVSLQYLVAAVLVLMGVLFGWGWWLAAGGIFAFRAMRRILAWHRPSTPRRRWAAALNPARLLTVMAINLLIDAAMFTGVLRWLFEERVDSAGRRRSGPAGSASAAPSPTHRRRSPAPSQ
jgi:glycosyltransferase involved in cell wall biosynthesis